MRIQISLTRISWSPLPGESWHLRSGYMIPIRLPWRPRARPSATLHEIPDLLNEEQTWVRIVLPTERSVKGIFAAKRGKNRCYFFSAASSLRKAAMVAADGSFRLLFLGRRFVLLQ